MEVTRERTGRLAPDGGLPAHRNRRKPGRRRVGSILGRLTQPLAASVLIALERRRLFILLPFATILGLFGYRLATFEPQLPALAVVALAIAVAGFALRRSLRGLRAVTLLAAFWAGFALLPVHGALFGTPMLAGTAYGTYQARVDAVVSDDGKSRRLIVSSLVPEADADPLRVRRARIVAPETPALAPGDTIRAPIWLYPVPGPILPGAYDAQFAGYFAGIGAYGRVTRSVTVIGHPASPSIDRLVARLRMGIARRVSAEARQPASGILRAVMVGDQSTVDDKTRARMSAAGLAHVLAISGLHLTLVAGGVFFALRALFALSHGLAQRADIRRLAAGGGILAALGYLMLSGESVSAVRATLMLMLVFGAILFGRRAITMRNVALAALFVLLVDPASLFRPGFQLSFAAVVALIGVYEFAPARDAPDHPLGRALAAVRGLAMTSLVAGGATAVFAAYHFQQTAPLGVIANVLAIPLVGLVVLPSAFAAVLLMPFGVEKPFIGLAAWGLDRILDIAQVVAVWSEGLPASPLLGQGALFIALGTLAWFAFFTTRVRFLAPLVAVPLIVLAGLDRPPDVLVADTTQAVAVREESGLALAAGRTGSFAVDVWGETYGQSIAAKAQGLTCDAVGCIEKSPVGFTVALIENPAAFPEDCRSADLVVTRLAAPAPCRQTTQVVDARDLARGGVHWLRWHQDTRRFTIRPAITDVHRPWRHPPE